MALSFLPPTKPSCHPLTLLNTHGADTASHHPLVAAVSASAVFPTPPISPAAEKPLNALLEKAVVEGGDGMLAPVARNGAGGGGVGTAITIEPFIQQTRLGGIFVREEDAVKLGLKRVGDCETYYGTCTRFTPVTVVIFNHHRLIQNVFALPTAFENTKYHDGVCGIDTLLELGFSVMVDRGMVYLTDPENSEYGGRM
ncbi:hypothetical protein HK097_001138 [Rhizophlyctis rosea]|uniref:Uncharacterized protein n=1 Tax=Rhizophlyctis rosea TaxID=64517 RepID=A0AAD5SCQ1_9FUNG|nr:hypothetical protein HK097_001138 [Rhizophlyctis rosea]